MPPDEFIGIAEKRGLIQEIGLWILNQVCSDFQHIFPMFEEENASFKMAVNISAKQLSDSLFPQKAVEIIDSYKIPHHFIEFEITETLVMDNPIEGAKVLSLFRSLGFSIALDDFGTGYSSLSYLQKLPITKMKIDRCFIKDYPEHDEGLMIKLLAGMSKILGINILTEGVENAEQLEYLKDIGCIYIQGYYFSRPVKFDKFISFLGDIHA